MHGCVSIIIYALLALTTTAVWNTLTTDLNVLLKGKLVANFSCITCVDSLSLSWVVPYCWVYTPCISVVAIIVYISAKCKTKKDACAHSHAIVRPWHIMLNFYRIMLCSTAHLVSQLCSDLRGKCS